MQVTFYKTSDNVHAINKRLNDPLIIDMFIKNEFDLNSPILMLKSDVTPYNYCKFLERCYFVDKVEKKGRVNFVHLSIDVLETYKDDILNSNARFNRKIKHGDFVGANLETSILKTFKKVKSNFTMADKHTIIVSTVGVQ